MRLLSHSRISSRLALALALVASSCATHSARTTSRSWSGRLYFGGHLLMFEDGFGPVTRGTDPEQNSLDIGEHSLRSVGRSFLANHRSYSFRNGAALRLFQPAATAAPWQFEEDGLELAWRDSQGLFVIESRVLGQSTRWYLGMAQLELRVDGSVVYEGPSGERTYQVPVALELNRNGMLTGRGR